MAAEKRTQLTSLTDLGDGSHDRANVPASSPQSQPEASQTAEHGLFRPLESSDPAGDMNNPPSRDLTDAFHLARSSSPRDAHGTSSRHGSGSPPSIQPVPLAPENTLGSGATSKSTATAVEEPPQENLDAVEVRNAIDNPDPRRGVCAHLNMAAGRRIIHETPLFSCEKPRWYWRRNQRTALAWTTLDGPTRDELQDAFAGLRGLSTRAGLSESQRQQLEGFVKTYAFADTGGSRVHICKIASHINHACGRCANAKAWVESDDPNYMSVRLLRPVSAGEQILINYKKRHPPCLVCGTKWTHKRSENQRRDTHVNPQQRNPPQQQPQESQQHLVQDQQQPPEDQQQPAEEHQQQPQADQQQPHEDQQQNASQCQQQPQTRGQRFGQRLRRVGRWFGPDDGFGGPVRLGDVGGWGI
ncbi:hypothetical protein B0J15DRAFT_115894 [Fusarium solani]|uniref:SET domain-containing protein n=1 Tax=Fusarium solani TaxID=169388 RepID=A0A9P9L4S7_FUSSL|nr:uncharacterized protein B0J15DRAFT_115894 [Fusarium solani]KAH7273972.1 hypothetical protein B0J15DRAFT_115894 [Fusarium solani]